MHKNLGYFTLTELPERDQWVEGPGAPWQALVTSWNMRGQHCGCLWFENIDFRMGMGNHATDIADRIREILENNSCHLQKTALSVAGGCG